MAVGYILYINRPLSMAILYTVYIYIYVYIYKYGQEHIYIIIYIYIPLASRICLHSELYMHRTCDRQK